MTYYWGLLQALFSYEFTAMPSYRSQGIQLAKCDGLLSKLRVSFCTLNKTFNILCNSGLWGIRTDFFLKLNSILWGFTEFSFIGAMTCSLLSQFFPVIKFVWNILFSSLTLPWVMASCHFPRVLPLFWSCHMFRNPRETVLFLRDHYLLLIWFFRFSWLL